MADIKKFNFIDFLLNAPLYAPVELDADLKTYTKYLRHEAFCPYCGKEKTFSFYDIINYPLYADNAEFILLAKKVPAELLLQMECSVCGTLLTYCLKIQGGIIQKIGQNPGVFFLQKHALTKYKSELPDKYRELSDAVFAFSNGMAVGACLMAKRLFECFIEADFKSYYKTNWHVNLNEKIKTLEKDKHYVFPPDMESFKAHITAFLKKPATEYEADECNEMFPVLRQCIEYLTDRNIQEKRRTARLKEGVRATLPKKENS